MNAVVIKENELKSAEAASAQLLEVCSLPVVRMDKAGSEAVGICTGHVTAEEHGSEHSRVDVQRRAPIHNSVLPPPPPPLNIDLDDSRLRFESLVVLVCSMTKTSRAPLTGKRLRRCSVP